MKMVEKTPIFGDFDWTFSWSGSELSWFMPVSTMPRNFVIADAKPRLSPLMGIPP